MSAMPAWAMISSASGWRSTSLAEPLGDRRQPAPAVDEDRHAPLRREREHRLQPLVGEEKALRPRMELDAARAAVEAALGLLDGALGEVEADERDEPAAGLLGPRERAVVRRA